MILYVLLCGYPPFDGDSNKDIFRAIIKSKLEFDEEEWGKISTEAKDLISQLLEKDPKTRAKVSNALTHDWFKKWEGDPTDVNEFQTKYLKRLKDYRAPNRLQYEVLSFLMKNLDTSERIRIKEVFRSITAKSSGDLTFSDLEEAFGEVGIDGATEHIEELKKCLDFDKNGKIKYTDFLLATINKNEALTEANISFAFHHFDTDNNGFITLDNLVEAFNREGKGLGAEEIKDILAQADISNTGKISIDDFVKIMKYDSHKRHIDSKD